MAPEHREALARPLDASLLRRTAERIAGDGAPAERAAACPEVEAFMTRHARCAVMQSEGPAAHVPGVRMTAECLDCGDALEWWKAPATVTALVGLN
jgi:hypothetical protein